MDFSNEQKSGDDEHGQVRSNLDGAAALGPDAHANSASQSAPSQGTYGANGTGTTNYASQGSSIPPLPPGKDLPPGVKCSDAISQTLTTLPPPQLLDILAQMKALASSEPHRATELLQQAPQLAAAVFQALLLMGLVSPDTISSVIEPGAPPPPTQAPNAGYGAPVVPNYQPGPAVNNTPPVQSMPYQPPAAPAYGAPPAPAAPPAQDTEALMRAVMELPEAQINMLPENEKQQILALRAQFAGQAQRR